jgi:hypothetical protein
MAEDIDLDGAAVRTNPALHTTRGIRHDIGFDQRLTVALILG